MLPELTIFYPFFLNSGAKTQTFVFAHKCFRRKVSETPDFLMKVKNLYRDITKRAHF